MESKRQKKVSKLIQKEISDILQREMRGVYGPALITVTVVRINPDLSFVRIYVSILGGGDKEKVLAGMNADSRQFRGHLGKRLGKHMRIIPDLRFFLDDTADHVEKIERIFSDIDRGSPDQEDA